VLFKYITLVYLIGVVGSADPQFHIGTLSPECGMSRCCSAALTGFLSLGQRMPLDLGLSLYAEAIRGVDQRSEYGILRLARRNSLFTKMVYGLAGFSDVDIAPLARSLPAAQAAVSNECDCDACIVPLETTVYEGSR
jgi:hypothetical protein